MTKDQFLQLQKEVDELNNKNIIGWGQVFLNAESAKIFYNKYLSHIPDIKLLAIATTENNRKTFLEEEAPKDNQGKTGIYQCLELGMPATIEDGFRGFEILGYGYGSFHSFICNSLEKDLSAKLKIKFNENGLIKTLAEAERANEYISNPDTGAEPDLWMPWAIIELPLNS